ncbi:anthranilate synthase component II [Babesia ovis]|uniref:indole-3-glycerol-phosphate synthase n=1 Tax=Babesia ovis TaxID=5869 RepID=A0A9W5TAU9_BABOV|nr:anthranilate synthase component II [Babesia ovis]
MIMDKYAYVDRLLEKHSDPADPLQLRLNFIECTSNHKLNEMLKKHSTSQGHALSIIADMKRRTPTHHPKCDNTILSYIHAPEVAKNMAQVGFDVIFVNTDETVYGGHISELHECFLELRKLGRRTRPAIVMKDIFLHPIQIAQAAEYRADGVLLNGPLLGNALSNMLTACHNMGIEAIVEVHTGADAMKAINAGANHLLVNQWDRVANALRPNRALEIREIVDDDVTLIAAGGIINYAQIHELGLIGYDAVVLGRRLMYNDIPEFVKSIRDWRAPSKSILRMSKALFFDVNYSDENRLCDIKLKSGHQELLNEMNQFYNNEPVNLSEHMDKAKEVVDSNITQMQEEASKSDDNANGNDEQNDKVIEITCGNPVNTCFVKNIYSTVESPSSMVDIHAELAKHSTEMFNAKLYMEREKWVQRYRHHYKSRSDAYKAQRLQKSIEMYTSFNQLDFDELKEEYSEQLINEVGRILKEAVNVAYKEAPRDENGEVILPK